MNKIKWIILIGVLFVLGFAGGVLYWSYLKAKNISNSAMEAAKNIQTETTVAPSPAESSQSFLTMPSEDVEGQDLSGVPRYPESIRISYYKAEDQDEYLIDYMAPDLSSKIIDFYKQKLGENGWLLRAADKGAWNFEKANFDLTIEIIQEDVLVPITQYRIQYLPTSSSEETKE